MRAFTADDVGPLQEILELEPRMGSVERQLGVPPSLDLFDLLTVVWEYTRPEVAYRNEDLDRRRLTCGSLTSGSLFVGGAAMKTASILVASLFVAPSASQAAVLTVTSSNDFETGSLRQCIADAQPGDEIQFDPRLDGTPIVLSHALSIEKDLVIRGRGADKTILSPWVEGSVGAPGWHGIQVSYSTVRVHGVTVTGEGRTVACTRNAWLCVGSPIRVRSGALELDECVVRGFRMRATALDDGMLVLSGVYVTSSDSAFRIRGSVVTDNTLEGLCHPLRGCPGRGVAAGIYNMGRLTIERSELSFNRATGDWRLLGSAAGITNGGVHPFYDGSCRIVNSTISDNTARSVELYRPCDIESSTVGDALSGWSDAGTVRNSILSECRESRPQSLGHNLDVGDTCGLSQPTDRSNVDPMLGPLEESFGPTRTRVPRAGSPVIDHGACDEETDQRSIPRPIDGNQDNVWMCDIGAVEYVPVCDDPRRPCDDMLYKPVGEVGDGDIIVRPGLH